MAWVKALTREMPIYEYCLIADAYMQRMRDEVGWGFTRMLMIHKKGVTFRYTLEEDTRSFREYFMNALDKSLAEKLCARILERSKLLLNAAVRLESTALDSLSEDELARSLAGLRQAYLDFWTVYPLPVFFEMYLDKEKLAPVMQLLEKTRLETGGVYEKANEAFAKIFDEIGRRREVKGELLSCALPNEDLNKVNPRELALRREFSVIECFPNGAAVAHTGVEANEFVSKNLGGGATRSNSLKGEPACKRGIVRGRVKLVFALADLELMEPSAIVVTPMTKVDFVPLLRKASAIVTDEGGVTSHAAIVSRELGIPCIVGTRDATEVLRDGDEIEVNSDSGEIKVLRN